jgi:CRISPR-associated endonuclease/helicase Cas3
MSASKNTINEVFTKIFGDSPYPHQTKTIESLTAGKSVVLRAPCGSGKTEACYASFMLGRGTLPDRLIYSLPTRALASEIADRIQKGTEKIGLKYVVSAQHGANSSDPFFKSDIIVATIDQTIGAYCCTPLSLPAYLGNIPAGAAVSSFHCFDEAHTYDRYLGLQTMLVLIQRSSNLGLPFLVMSATLPDSFLRWFEDKFGETVEIVEGDDESVEKRRNRHVILHWENLPLDSVQVFEAAKNYNRIMIVCNTVNRAQVLYKAVLETLREKGFKVFLLHSRFLVQDRRNIEIEMRGSLDAGAKTCLITTQVCEVGMDISCDLLLTELAPADSLIQRMGRCARKGGKGEVRIFEVGNPAPYSECEMIECKKYLAEKLESHRIGWEQELDLVNAILGKRFEQIMKDEQRRRTILKSLGDAAFKGNKSDVEKNIRELFSANLTIHDCPSKLGFYDLLRMPWLEIDARVLKKHLVGKTKFWKVEFEHNENGLPDLSVKSAENVFPYDFYVVHPDSAKYTQDCGLLFGAQGENFIPLEVPPKQKETIKYEREPWIDHTRKSCTAFEKKVKNSEGQSLKLLSTLLGKSLVQTEGLVLLAVAMHDLGKLNVAWQRSIGATTVPLAHIPISPKILRSARPAHATVSAYSISPLLERVVGNEMYAVAFELAIGHHHHSRAENVPSYRLEWTELYKQVIREIGEKYQLDVHGAVREEIGISTLLDSSFPDFERWKQYTAYCIVARLIRLSDVESFGVGKALVRSS